jgi:hypothetical protein
MSECGNGLAAVNDLLMLQWECEQGMGARGEQRGALLCGCVLCAVAEGTDPFSKTDRSVFVNVENGSIRFGATFFDALINRAE